jgi:hypothetical protein
VSSALQSLVGRLLTASNLEESLASWPSRALTGLLSSLRDARNFILRRSAGFGFAFLAILRSEPRNAPAQLLPLAISHLFSLAACPVPIFSPSAAAMGGGAAPPPPARTIIHALNVLCLLFRDSALGSECSNFIHPALATALGGFSSPSWAIRNSSMMLFAAATDRALGTVGKNTAPPSPPKLLRREGGDARLPAASFFAHNPPLLGLLRGYLAAGSDSGRERLHPSLFPVLLLLSRLSGGAAVEQEQQLQQLTPLCLPLLALCGHSHGFIRGLAGSVYASLAPPSASAASLAGMVTPGSEACHDALQGALAAARSLLALQYLALVEGGSGTTLISAQRHHTSLAPLQDALLSSAPAIASNRALPGIVRAEAAWAVHEAGAWEALGCGSAKASPAAALAFSTACTCLQEPHDSGPAGGVAALLGRPAFYSAVGYICVHWALVQAAEDAGAAGVELKCPAIPSALAALSHASCDIRRGATKALKVCLKHAPRVLFLGGASERNLQGFLFPSKGTASGSLGWQLVEFFAGRGWGGGWGASGERGESKAGADGAECDRQVQSYALHALALILGAYPPASPPPSLPPLASLWSTLLCTLGAGQAVESPTRCHALRSLGCILRGVINHGGWTPALGLSPAAFREAWRDSLAYLGGVGGLGGVGVDREAQTPHTQRLAALCAVRTSGVLALPLQHPLQPLAQFLVHSPLQSLWPAVLQCLLDGDDEVREEARFTVVTALGALGEDKCRRLLGELPFAVRAAERSSVLFGAQPSISALFLAGQPPSTAPAVSQVLLLCERRALLAAHQALALAVLEEVKRADTEQAPSQLHSSRPLWEAVSAMCRAALSSVLLAGMEGVREVLLGAAAHSAPGVSTVPLEGTSLLPYDTSMLLRTTFLPNSTANGYTESLALGGLALGLYLCCHRAKRMGDENAEAAQLVAVAAQLVASAGSVDLPLDPFLTFSQGYAPESGSADAFPSVFAAARVAEGLLSGLL